MPEAIRRRNFKLVVRVNGNDVDGYVDLLECGHSIPAYDRKREGRVGVARLCEQCQNRVVPAR